MAKMKFSILLPLLLLLTSQIYGDIIVPTKKPTKICTRIINLTDFPELVVVAYANCVVLPKSRRAFRVRNNTYIKVRKNCPVDLYVMNLDYYKENDLDEIDWEQDKNVQKLNVSIGKAYYYSYDYSSMIVDLQLAQKNVYYLYKTKQAFRYKYGDDGVIERPDRVQHFKDDVNPTEPIIIQ